MLERSLNGNKRINRPDKVMYVILQKFGSKEIVPSLRGMLVDTVWSSYRTF